MVTWSQGDVAVCTLGSLELADALRGHGRIAVAESLLTANRGIEELVSSLVMRSGRIGYLLVCGRDSPLFRQGSSLIALSTNGCDTNGRIIGAEGYEPYVANLPAKVVVAFRRRFVVVDEIGEESVSCLRRLINDLPITAVEPLPPVVVAAAASCGPRVITLKPGGPRRPLATSGGGEFVITIDRESRALVLRHHGSDPRICHEMRSHSAEALVLGVIGHRLISPQELSHAAYLGAELAKAEVALRETRPYVQDRPLQVPLPRPGSTSPGHRHRELSR